MNERGARHACLPLDADRCSRAVFYFFTQATLFFQTTAGSALWDDIIPRLGFTDAVRRAPRGSLVRRRPNLRSPQAYFIAMWVLLLVLAACQFLLTSLHRMAWAANTGSR